MTNKLKPDEALEGLESMHERVEKLRSKLKHIGLSSYAIAGTTDNAKTSGAARTGEVSKKYT